MSVTPFDGCFLAIIKGTMSKLWVTSTQSVLLRMTSNLWQFHCYCVKEKNRSWIFHTMSTFLSRVVQTQQPLISTWHASFFALGTCNSRTTKTIKNLRPVILQKYIYSIFLKKKLKLSKNWKSRFHFCVKLRRQICVIVV